MAQAASGSSYHLPILMYHNVARLPRDLQIYRSLYVSPTAFAHQMWLLYRMGYTGLSMSAAMPYFRGERQGRVVAITLDDGYADNLESALPVLSRFNFSATIYVVNRSIGRFNTWDAKRMGIRKQLMTADELRQWHQAGMEIGAHSQHHPRLTHCSDYQLLDEVYACKADLEDRFGVAVTQFCYPYGDVDDRVADVTQHAGYEAATTSHRGRATRDSNLWRLPRVQIARHHFLPQFAMRVLTGYEDRRA